MLSRRWMVGILLGSVLLMSGCRHCCKRSGCPAPTGGPPGPTGMLPPQNIPLDPPPSTGMRPEVLLPTPPAKSSNYPAPPARPNVRLGEPNWDGPVAGVEEKKPIAKTPPPAAFNDVPPAPLPVGISSYAQVKDGVSTGLRPELDGLDWLQSKSVKTVIFLRNGKEDDSSDRKQVEKRGLKYVSLTVAPEAINQALIVEFNRLVDDPTGRGVFVYDLDGKRAGVMWYLYFRTTELLSDDEARVRAGRFGLKDKGDAEQTQLWTAVQKYMSDRNP